MKFRLKLSSICPAGVGAKFQKQTVWREKRKDMKNLLCKWLRAKFIHKTPNPPKMAVCWYSQMSKSKFCVCVCLCLCQKVWVLWGFINIISSFFFFFLQKLVDWLDEKFLTIICPQKIYIQFIKFIVSINKWMNN